MKAVNNGLDYETEEEHESCRSDCLGESEQAMHELTYLQVAGEGDDNNVDTRNSVFFQ